MGPAIRTAAKWGFIIGIVNLVWLYLAYYLGLHTNGIVVFQIFIAVWVALTFVGFVLALRSVKRPSPSVGYLGGLAAGAVAALVSALVAVLAQIGYFRMVHPEWPQVMEAQTRDHFTAQGLTPEEVEQRVAQAREYFTLSNYATSSAMAALLLGIVLSAVILLFLRRRSIVGPNVVLAN